MASSHNTRQPRSSVSCPSASHELCFGCNICFCCKTRETLTPSDLQFTVPSTVLLSDAAEAQVCGLPRSSPVRQEGGRQHVAHGRRDPQSRWPHTQKHQEANEPPAFITRLRRKQGKRVRQQDVEMETWLAVFNINLAQV